jgi:hypothetical protein
MTGNWGAMVLLGCLALAGCAGTASRVDSERRLMAVESRSVPPDIREAIIQGRVLIGMSDGMVAASWGMPKTVRSKPAANAVRETWTYGVDRTPGYEAELTFEDGTLVEMRATRLHHVLDLLDRPASFEGTSAVGTRHHVREWHR